jgi:peptidoglycan/LPS O-acetylase OafA/YrhL
MNRSFQLDARASGYLDLVRGLAAVAVMVSHLRALFFVPFGEVGSRNVLVILPYFLTSLGHQAVVVFFVLSGYFISRSVLRTVGTEDWSWREYLLRRSVRLYLVLIPALLLGGLLDLAGPAMFGTDGPYGAGPGYQFIITAPVADRVSWSIGAANAAFLQWILAPTFGSNGALWSLYYEFWFYMMFPCLALSVMPRIAWWRRVAFTGLLVAIAAFIGVKVASYFLVWLLGTAVVLAPKRKLRWGLWIVALVVATALCLAAIMVLRVTSWEPLAVDLAMGMAVAILVYVLAVVPDGAPRNRSSRSVVERAGKWSASFSYSLYLVHLPALVFLDAAWVWSGGGKWQPGMLSLLGGIGLAAAMIAYGWGTSRLTEAHTEQISCYLVRATRSGPSRTAEQPSQSGSL